MQFPLCSAPPCKCKKIPYKCEKVRIKEVLHLFRCYTHTPHTPRVAGFDFWKTIAANVGKIIQIQKAFPVLMYIAAFSHSEGKLASSWSIWIASRKLMPSTILHVSLISPDAIAAVKVVESCLARSWIFGMRRVASVGVVVSMGTL